MTAKAKFAALPTLSAAVATIAVAFPVPAQAGPLDCASGYVWRNARDGDAVCVTPATRDATVQQNASAAQNREPNGGAYGPNTCKQGFVWREAFNGDTVCVTPAVRQQTWNDNAAAESRKAVNQPAAPPARNPGCDILNPLTGQPLVQC